MKRPGISFRGGTSGNFDGVKAFIKDNKMSTNDYQMSGKFIKRKP